MILAFGGNRTEVRGTSTGFSIRKLIPAGSTKRYFLLGMKKLREAKGLSQGDVHRATGIDRAYISNLEAGKQNPTLETIGKIAEALGVGSGELLK